MHAIPNHIGGDQQSRSTGLRRQHMRMTDSGQGKRRMPGWVIALIVTPLALCLTCGALGYFVVVPRVRGGLENSREATSNQIAESVQASLTKRIEAHPDGAKTFIIQGTDLNVNNADIPGEWGVKTGTDGTRLWGIDTEITPAGITLHMGDTSTYSGVPHITAGRIELTQVVLSGDAPRMLLSADGFADGMERGINRALDDHALEPTTITLGNGFLTIDIVPRAQSI
jgi:hypothetical protein